MKRITNISDLTELPQMVTDGFISVRQHSTAPLRIVTAQKGRTRLS